MGACELSGEGERTSDSGAHEREDWRVLVVLGEYGGLRAVADVGEVVSADHGGFAAQHVGNLANRRGGLDRS